MFKGGEGIKSGQMSRASMQPGSFPLWSGSVLHYLSTITIRCYFNFLPNPIIPGTYFLTWRVLRWPIHELLSPQRPLIMQGAIESQKQKKKSVKYALFFQKWGENGAHLIKVTADPSHGNGQMRLSVTAKYNSLPKNCINSSSNTQVNVNNAVEI